jgi:nanoRNase/pAp phosphatase (c-di-AMP/oligoRNAs hydrolase)
MDEMRVSIPNPIEIDRLQKLRNVIGAGPVLILTHDNPDPDGLASGLGLARLFASWGIHSDLVYSGLISRAENKAMLNLLTPEWVHSDVLPDLDAYSAVALVDTQPGAGNNDLPSEVIPDIVIDHHHPVRDNISKVQFVDLNPNVGATASLVFQYLEAAGVEIDAKLATGIFYGIKTDTRGLSRGDSPNDQAAYFRLLTLIDRRLLVQVEQAGLPREYFQKFSEGLHSAVVYGNVVVADLGEMHRPDFVGEMADMLIRLEHTRAVLCMGVHGDLLYLSLRTMPMNDDAGLLVQSIVPEPGKAGGHGTMAGGQVPLDDGGSGPIKAEIKRSFLDVLGETREGKPLMA